MLNSMYGGSTPARVSGRYTVHLQILTSEKRTVDSGMSGPIYIVARGLREACVLQSAAAATVVVGPAANGRMGASVRLSVSGRYVDYLVYTCRCSLQRLNSVAVFQTQSTILA